MQNKGITLRLKIAFVQPPGREGEFSWEFLVEVCSSVLHILMSTPFQTKKCHCPQPFSDLTSKIHTRFRQNATFKYTLAEIRSLLLRFERPSFFFMTNSHDYLLEFFSHSSVFWRLLVTKTLSDIMLQCTITFSVLFTFFW